MASNFPYKRTISESALDGGSVSPDDSTDLEYNTRMVIIGGAGTLKVTFATGGGGTKSFNSLPAGAYPICVNRIWTTGTTATNISVLY